MSFRHVVTLLCVCAAGVMACIRAHAEQGAEIDIQPANGQVSFPPLSRQAMDIFFDSLRAGSSFQPTPLRASQAVDANTSGMWAGTRTEISSQISEVILRFKPTDEARLERAAMQQRAASTDLLSEEFDVNISLSPSRMVIRHPLAETKLARTGLIAELSDRVRSPARTEFIAGFRDAGMYFSVPSMTREEVSKAWGVFVCPRQLVIARPNRTAPQQYQLHPSPYALSEVKFTMAGRVEAGTLPGTKRERVLIETAVTATMPQSYETRDEVVAVSPWLQLQYKPRAPFEFFRFPHEGNVQEGMLTRVELQNAAGYVRRQSFSHVLYVHALQEPSPIAVIVNANRVYRDDGTCYVVLAQRSVWSEYERREPIPAATPIAK